MERCSQTRAGVGGGAKTRVEEGEGFEMCWGSVIGALGLMSRRAFDAFERSKEPLETRTTTTRTKTTPRGVEVTETVTVRRVERAGDVRILRALLQCLDREMRVLKELHGDPKNYVDYVDDATPLSEADLDALDALADLDASDEDSAVNAAGDSGDAVNSAVVDSVVTGAVVEHDSVAASVSGSEPASRTTTRNANRSAIERKPFPRRVPQTLTSVSPVVPSHSDRPPPRGASAPGDLDELQERLDQWRREANSLLLCRGQPQGSQPPPVPAAAAG